MPVAPPESPPPVNPGAEIGDRLYYRHPAHGVTHGRVTAHGEHGVTCRHADGTAHRVPWADVLGHKQRQERRYTVLDRGEDGAIVADERGRTSFLAGDLPEEEADEEEGEAAPLAKSLLVDIGALSCGCSDHALDTLHKALAEDGDLWAPHDSLWISQIIENLTAQGLGRTEELRLSLGAWLEGQYRYLSPAPAPDLLQAWSPDLAARIHAYLAGKPQAEWLASDWALLVDYLVREHLSVDALREALQSATRQGSVMGVVQASLQANLTVEQVAAIGRALTESGKLAKAETLARLNAIQQDYALQRSADLVVDFTATARAQVKRLVLNQMRESALAGEPQAVAAGKLQQQLFDQMGELNRDWRRIALTEVGEATNQGLIASLPVGSYVRRLEQYYGACPFCKKIDGAIVQIVAPDQEDKDWDKTIWVGKTNVGRSASPRKRVGDDLVERTDSELWKIPAGLAHPNCRGLFVPVDSLAKRDDLTLWLFKDVLPPAPEA